ncbi:hypothetical protein H0R92_00485 [Treponema sp. OMZ 840]|uniref:hypothetical protein n=1 Tax=Treponema sp. OMZ 840 TaxID=244313 RepID=UPI003D89FF1C
MKNRKKRKPFLFKITNRSILFLFSFSLIIFFFYAAGNRQQFSDENQKLLLNIVRFVSAGLLCFLCAGFVQIVVYLIKTKNKRLIPFLVLYIFFFIVCFAQLLFTSGVLFFAK